MTPNGDEDGGGASEPEGALRYDCVHVDYIHQAAASRRLSVYRRFAKKCGGCGQGICPNDLVRRARDQPYHLKCFTCSICQKQLKTGEELYFIDAHRFICKEDYLSSKYCQGRRGARELCGFLCIMCLICGLSVFAILCVSTSCLVCCCNTSHYFMVGGRR